MGISIGHKDSENIMRRNIIESNALGGVCWRDEIEPMAAHNNTFEENTVRNNGKFGLKIEGETNGTVIRGNVIETEGPDEAGIIIGKNTGNVVIEDNQIRSARQMCDERPGQTGGDAGS